MLDGDRLSGKEAYEYILEAHEEHERLRTERDAQYEQLRTKEDEQHGKR